MDEFEADISPIMAGGIEVPSRGNKECAPSSAAEVENNNNKLLNVNWAFETNALILLASDASFSISELTSLASPASVGADSSEVESLKLAILISVGCDDKRELDLAIRHSVAEMLLNGRPNAKVSEICQIVTKYLDANRISSLCGD
jgi:hypothetical protein